MTLNFDKINHKILFNINLNFNSLDSRSFFIFDPISVAHFKSTP